MQPDEAEVRSAMDIFLDRALQHGSSLLDPKAATAGRLLRWLLPRRVFKAIARQIPYSYSLSFFYYAVGSPLIASTLWYARTLTPSCWQCNVRL